MHRAGLYKKLAVAARCLAKVGGRRSKVEGRRSKVEGRRSKVGGRTPAATGSGGLKTRVGLVQSTRLRIDLPELPPGQARGAPITIDFEGRALPAFQGQPVAVALFAAGVKVLGRSSKYHRPRGLFCLEGHCASCYLRIDGRPNRRACMTPARAGLRCERQNAFPSVDVDLLRAADWLFPEGMDHHTLMTDTRLGNRLFLKLVRQMGGSGTLPDHPAREATGAESSGETRVETCDLCVVGGGPAGLVAARTFAEATPGARVLLFDEQAAAGGSLLAQPGGSARGAALAADARRAGVRLTGDATAIAFFPEDLGGVLAVVTATGLRRIQARRYLYATGAYDQNLSFADNDRPGIVSARACGRLAFHFGVRPVPANRRVVVLATTATTGAAVLAAALNAAGVEAELLEVGGPDQRVLGARGTQTVRGLQIACRRRDESNERDPDAGVETRVVVADLVAVAAVPAPASELARQHGAEVILDPSKGGFAVTVDDQFRTSAAGVYACGDVTGFAGSAAAARAGEAAGRAIAAEPRADRAR
jgi:sarcosine oxidase subunit alpha